MAPPARWFRCPPTEAVVRTLRDELARSAVAQSANAQAGVTKDDFDERYPRPLTDRELRIFLEFSTEALLREPNVIDLALDVSEELNAVTEAANALDPADASSTSPTSRNRVYVVGDIHGQYFDLCALLDKINARGDADCIVFTGDFVDRGSWGLEVLLLLLALRIRSPSSKASSEHSPSTSDARRAHFRSRGDSFSSFSARDKVSPRSARAPNTTILTFSKAKIPENADLPPLDEVPTTPTGTSSSSGSRGIGGSGACRSSRSSNESDEEVSVPRAVNVTSSLCGSEIGSEEDEEGGKAGGGGGGEVEKEASVAKTADEVVASYGQWRLPRVVLLRGNHETGSVAAAYGFFDEVRDKYGAGYVQLFRKLFAALPLAATVRCGVGVGSVPSRFVQQVSVSPSPTMSPHLSPRLSFTDSPMSRLSQSATSSTSSTSKNSSTTSTLSSTSQGTQVVRPKLSRGVLLVHGGLWRASADAKDEKNKESAEINTGLLKELRGVRRQGYEDPPRCSLVCDLLWSDPSASDGLRFNADRGCGLRYGPDTLEEFLQQHRLSLLMRSHEGPNLRQKRLDMPQTLHSEGHSNDICWEDGAPACITVFSAPDYPQFQRVRSSSSRAVSPGFSASGSTGVEMKRSMNAAACAVLMPEPLGEPEEGKAVKVRWNIDYVSVPRAPRPKGVKYCKI